MIKKCMIVMIIIYIGSVVQAASLELPEEKAKALRLAKLFDRYPDGYGNNDEQKNQTKNKREVFLSLKDGEFSRLANLTNEYFNDIKKMKKEPSLLLMRNHYCLLPELLEIIFVETMRVITQEYFVRDIINKLTPFIFYKAHKIMIKDRILSLLAMNDCHENKEKIDIRLCNNQILSYLNDEIMDKKKLLGIRADVICFKRWLLKIADDFSKARYEDLSIFFYDAVFGVSKTNRSL